MAQLGLVGAEEEYPGAVEMARRALARFALVESGGSPNDIAQASALDGVVDYRRPEAPQGGESDWGPRDGVLMDITNDYAIDGWGGGNGGVGDNGYAATGRPRREPRETPRGWDGATPEVRETAPVYSCADDIECVVCPSVRGFVGTTDGISAARSDRLGGYASEADVPDHLYGRRHSHRNSHTNSNNHSNSHSNSYRRRQPTVHLDGVPYPAQELASLLRCRMSGRPVPMGSLPDAVDPPTARNLLSAIEAGHSNLTHCGYGGDIGGVAIVLKSDCPGGALSPACARSVIAHVRSQDAAKRLAATSGLSYAGSAFMGAAHSIAEASGADRERVNYSLARAINACCSPAAGGRNVMGTDIEIAHALACAQMAGVRKSPEALEAVRERLREAFPGMSSRKVERWVVPWAYGMHRPLSDDELDAIVDARYSPDAIVEVCALGGAGESPRAIGRGADERGSGKRRGRGRESFLPFSLGRGEGDEGEPVRSSVESTAPPRLALSDADFAARLSGVPEPVLQVLAEGMRMDGPGVAGVAKRYLDSGIPEFVCDVEGAVERGEPLCVPMPASMPVHHLERVTGNRLGPDQGDLGHSTDALLVGYLHDVCGSAEGIY